MPLTEKTPGLVEVTVPTVVMPSPQLIEAVKSAGAAPPRAAGEGAAAPLEAVPPVAAEGAGKAVNPAARAVARASSLGGGGGGQGSRGGSFRPGRCGGG